MINCLVVDDELPALRLLSDYVQKIPELELTGTAEDAFSALEILHSQKVDLLFLDIQMPGLTGINMLKSLKNKPYVIFTTAYAKYALDGYDLDVVDYLLKPITFDRFLKAVNKVMELYKMKNRPEEGEQISTKKDHIFVKADYKLIKVFFNDILYIEGLSEYVIIHVPNKNIITLQSLKNLEEILPSDRFLRIHKSYIVSLPKISAIVGNSVEIAGKKITIGKSYREKVIPIIKGEET